MAFHPKIAILVIPLAAVMLLSTCYASTIAKMPVDSMKPMMDRLLELDDTFYYGGVHTLMGVYAISRSGMFGVRSYEAQGQFQEAFEISESKFLLWHFLYAKYYDVQTRDRDLFVATLSRIIDTPDDILPDQAFANAAVKEKARELLKYTDEYFRRATPPVN